MIDLRLYVSGRTPRNEAMAAWLRTVLDERDIAYDLTVMDVFERPEESFKEAVYATPTLIKRSPQPIARIVGELFDRERVLVGLNISHAEQ
jgi:circadian clock protein KaiB